MAMETPDIGLDEQDQAKTFDETHLDDDAEFVTLEEIPDVYDATRALGDSRDLEALDADELDPDALDGEALEEDEDLSDQLLDDLEDDEEDDEIDGEDDEDGAERLEPDEVPLTDVADVDAETDPDDDDEADYESENLSDDDLEDLGYRDKDGDEDGAPTRGHPDDVRREVHPHQDELLDEGVEETFPASDPVSVKRIT